MIFHNDDPVETQGADHLQYQPAIKSLAKALQQVHPPFVLGIHGDWGAGKTSVLRLLQLEIPQTPPSSFIVFFEPWRYQYESAPAIALLQAIRTQLSQSQALLDKAGKLASVTMLTALTFLDKLIIGVPSGIATTARAEGERLEKAKGQELLAADAIRNLFESAIEAIIKHTKGNEGGKGRLVVLVDDLDRCSDEAVVRLLEAMKLYFNVPNAIFIIAADPRAIERAVRRVLFKDNEQQGRALAREYCGKLIQAIWEVPIPKDLPQFIKHLLPGPLGIEVAKLQENFKFLPPNPRRLKRFLGELCLRLQSGNWTETHPEFKSIVAIQAIQTFHPDLYRVLIHHPAFIQQIQRLCMEGASWAEAERPKQLKELTILGGDFPWELPTDPHVLLCSSLLKSCTFTNNDIIKFIRMEV